MRLKVLIEDLFEISKASSQNVNLNPMNVDIVNLFKQVKFELEDKFEEKGLEFRITFPEEKVILRLDSQKTYRIFENLLNNIVKYALPGTRVYVEIEKTEKDVFIRLKNISATELTFNPEEITERFVRGDESRNTEGSGLGLAIVKSFVGLQGGSFHIETRSRPLQSRNPLGFAGRRDSEAGSMKNKWYRIQFFLQLNLVPFIFLICLTTYIIQLFYFGNPLE